jgi:hypothetical protein
MFGIGRKKDPFTVVTCKGKKLDGGAANGLKVEELDLPALVKACDQSELCSKVSLGRVYQKPGTMLEENRPEETGYSARYDKITKSIGVGLRQGLMRQTMVIATKEPQALAAEIGLALEADPPPEVTAQ